MTFLTSIFLGLSMGSGALFSIYQGKGDKEALKSSICHAFYLILSVTLLLNAAVFLLLDSILSFLHVPAEVWDGMRQYLAVMVHMRILPGKNAFAYYIGFYGKWQFWGEKRRAGRMPPAG